MAQSSGNVNKQTFGEAVGEVAHEIGRGLKWAGRQLKRPTVWGVGVAATLEIERMEIMGEAYRDNPVQQAELSTQLGLETPISWLASRATAWALRKANVRPTVARTAMVATGTVVGMAGGRVAAYAVAHHDVGWGVITDWSVAEANAALPTDAIAAVSAIPGAKMPTPEPQPAPVPAEVGS